MAVNPAPLRGPRGVTVLGATGSVGCNTLDLIARNPGRYRVEALTAGRNVDLLIEQARTFKPALAVIADPALYGRLKDGLSGSGVEAAAGAEAVVEAAQRPAEWVMAGIVGAAGLAPTLAAVRRGAIVAFANKECLVSAGAFMLAEVKRHGATLLPVDSEHNAIFQVFETDRREAIERIILTASGGPFRTMDHAAMSQVTPVQAVAHPNWVMGDKISVDSATMMNKGLEIIEAHYLFGMNDEQIEVVIHPQSVIHSMVGYIDGSVLAQLGMPDMRTPIAYALGWPARITAPVARLDFTRIGHLTFEAPDVERFPALKLARQALQCGGGAPTILNAANEVAVHGFLAGRIGFLDIARTVEATLGSVPARALASLGDVLAADGEARVRAKEVVEMRSRRG
ncbi:MAG: 1-deoxy-D-xylulose-5-phosphate reductoisomerase [Alphaproteobacteria bacterium]|nr:1-deoxy-D-xylulose-5-phosphate reductoisomerase [Alphaproteobacteria bacterium]